MFNFRIIETADGTQIIDRQLKTPYSSLTPVQMVEYTELDKRLAFMDTIERKSRREAEKQRKMSHNLFYRLACVVGIL